MDLNVCEECRDSRYYVWREADSLEKEEERSVVDRVECFGEINK